LPAALTAQLAVLCYGSNDINHPKKCVVANASTA
jgi:hypothetical protein